MHSVTKRILVLHLLPRAIVGIDLTCESVNPLIPSDVECVCKNAPGTDIDWLIDDGFNSNCVLSSICAPQYSGYRYSMNMTENVYKMTINSYNYSDCTTIACKDPSDGSIMRSIVPSSIFFDTTFPTLMTEPGSNNSNGTISVTTGCISGFSDVESDWYIIVDGLEEKYDTSFFNKTDHTSCLNCDTHVNGQKTIGFEHIEASEASGYETKTGRFKVYLYHEPTDLQLTLTSRYYYTVQVNKPSESDGPANNKLGNGLIALGVFIVILVIIVIIITLTCVPPKFTKIELHDTKIHLEWTDSLNCCQKIFGYNIVYKPKKGQVRDTCCREEITNEKHCTLERLDPMAIYEITLSRTVRCCKSLTANISVITLLSGMPNDQKYHTHSTAIEVKWAKPCCIRKEQILYEVTCNEVKKEITDQTTYTIKDLIPGKMYKVKVFANDNGTNCLMFAKEISTTPIKVTLEDVCYEQRQLCVNCNIKWKVEDFEMPEPSHTLLYNVICYSGKQQVHNTGNLTDSSYTIPKLNLDCSYSIHVYAVYHSVTLEPPGKIVATPYKPTQLKHTAEETEIILEWQKPDHTGEQEFEYEVLLDDVKIITTSETSYRIENLMPGKIYGIKIFTIINGLKSLPLEKEIGTYPYVISFDEEQLGDRTLENMPGFRKEIGHERAYFSKCELVTETNY